MPARPALHLRRWSDEAESDSIHPRRIWLTETTFNIYFYRLNSVDLGLFAGNNVRCVFCYALVVITNVNFSVDSSWAVIIIESVHNIPNGVFALPDNDTDTDTNKMGLQPIYICVGVSVCVGVGQCEPFCIF